MSLYRVEQNKGAVVFEATSNEVAIYIGLGLFKGPKKDHPRVVIADGEAIWFYDSDRARALEDFESEFEPLLRFLQLRIVACKAAKSSMKKVQTDE